MDMTEEQIEAVARGLAWSDLSQKKKRGVTASDPLHWKLFEEDARAAIAAYEATLVPVGHMWRKDGNGPARFNLAGYGEWMPNLCGWTETRLYAITGDQS